MTVFDELYRQLKYCTVNCTDTWCPLSNVFLRKLWDKKVELLHTLNGSGVATPRLMVALLETYQKQDGSISFPKDVAEFLGIDEIIY